MGKFVVKLTIDEVRDFVKNNSSSILANDVYVGVTEKMTFLCSCGNIFHTSFQKFKDRNKRQCNECSIKERSKKSVLSFEEVKKNIENESKCKLLSGIYENDKSLLLLKCGCGNTFTTSYRYFRSNNKKQCDDCGLKNNAESKCKYTYSYVFDLLDKNNCVLLNENISKYITTKENLNIVCRCGELFITTLEMINTYNKFQCNSCSFKNAPTSIGELTIKKYLEANEIKFKTQYYFNDCKYKYKLRFDFAIFNKLNSLQFLIEYDGIQHFKPYEYYGGNDNYKNIKIRDEIKTKYCEENNIMLIRIPYFEIDNINNILDNIISVLVA